MTITQASAADPDTDMADDETITDLLAAVIAEAGALLRQRRSGYRAATKPVLRRLAGYAAEALSAAGAGPVGIVATPAMRDTAKATGAAILEAALAGNDGVPIGTVLGLGGRRFTFSPDFAEDANPWHYAGGGDVADEDPMPSWSTSAALVGAGAEVLAVPVPIGDLAPQPGAETAAAARPPRPDTPAGRVAAELGELLAGHLCPGEFTLSESSGVLHAGVGSDDDVAHLRAVAALLPDSKVTTLADDKFLYVIVTGVRDGITVRVSDVFSRKFRADQLTDARAWLAELGVEVQS